MREGSHVFADRIPSAQLSRSVLECKRRDAARLADRRRHSSCAALRRLAPALPSPRGLTPACEISILHGPDAVDSNLNSVGIFVVLDICWHFLVVYSQANFVVFINFVACPSPPRKFVLYSPVTTAHPPCFSSRLQNQFPSVFLSICLLP
jgi:hypothetical protein